MYVKEITIRKMSQPSKHLALLIFFSSLNVVVGTCPKACDSCVSDTCVTCDVGSYLESGSCYTCPERCISCYNSGACYNCTGGYYGLSCEKNCSSSTCLNNTCDKDSGICLHGCIEGYFLSGSSCYLCAFYCKTCAYFSNNCLECKDGFYGPSCQYPCSHCKDGICTRDTCTYGCGDGFFRGNEACNSCYINCTSCLLFDNCTACVDGYFGPGCQFKCTDCSPCNQDGSCPKTTGQAPTRTTQQTSPWNESVTTTLSTTTIATTASSQTSQDSISILTTASSQTSHDSISILTTASSQTSHDSTSILTTASSQTSHDSISTLIIYAAAGGGGGLVVIVLVIVVVVVCKRRGNAKQSDKLAENIDMTENENYISAEDIDEISRNSSNAQKDVQQNKQEVNGDLYSLPNKMHRPTMVTMETRSGQDTEDSPSNISPILPVKSNMYSDLI